MPSLTDLVHVIPPDRDEEPEDIFASAPGLIFTDDLRVLHGDPDSLVVYKSRRFGPIELRTADPVSENERRLFSHYVWNASLKLAELISADGDEWSVRDETVLELGAGMHKTSDAVFGLAVLTMILRSGALWHRRHPCRCQRCGHLRLPIAGCTGQPHAQR